MYSIDAPQRIVKKFYPFLCSLIGVLDADAGPPAGQQTQEEPVHKVKYTAKFKPGQDYTIILIQF
jgi:hypothetical protein